jgi:hypothetical protein
MKVERSKKVQAGARWLLALALVAAAPGCRKSERPLGPPPAAPNTVTLDLGDIQSVTIDYRHSGWGSRQRNFPIERKGDRWEADGTPVDAAAVQALAGAFDLLVPSDGLKSCNSHTDDYPHFAIQVRGAHGTAEVSSDSNCAELAPWNVVSGGRLFVQASGKIGRALDPLLRATKIPSAIQFGNEGALSFDYLSRRDAPKGVTLAEPFAAALVRRASASQVVLDAFPGRRVLDVSAWCTTEDNPACSRLEAHVTVALEDPFAIEVEATIDNFEVQRFAPAPKEMAATLASSKLYRALVASSSTRPLVLRWSEEKNCGQARRSAEDLGWRTPSKCGYWFTSAAAKEGAPPSLFYIPALQVAWVRHGEGAAERAFYQALGASERFPEDARTRGRTYVRLDGTFLDPKSR